MIPSTEVKCSANRPNVYCSYEHAVKFVKHIYVHINPRARSAVTYPVHQKHASVHREYVQ